MSSLIVRVPMLRYPFLVSKHASKNYFKWVLIGRGLALCLVKGISSPVLKSNL